MPGLQTRHSEKLPFFEVERECRVCQTRHSEKLPFLEVERECRVCRPGIRKSCLFWKSSANAGVRGGDDSSRRGGRGAEPRATTHPLRRPRTSSGTFEGGDERVGELGGDVAAGGERGVALVEDHMPLLSGHKRHDRRHLACRDELHASGCVHGVQRGCECAREPLGYLPASDGGREEGVRKSKKV